MSRRSTVVVGGLSLAVAVYAVIAYSLRGPNAPEREMWASPGLFRTAFYTHVFGAAVAMAVGPFQFAQGLRARRPQVHRWLGRLYLVPGILVGGLSGLVLATLTFGGLIGRAGFFVLSLLWLGSGWHAWRAIRAGRVADHRRWMTRNFALTFAAVTLRFYLPLSLAAGIAFDTAYAAIAWLCWVPNLVAVEWWRRRAPVQPSLS
jgi:uncharacterized membrane protein